MRYFLGITFGVVLGISFAPIPAHATAYHYTCADITSSAGGVSCASDVITFNGNNANFVNFNDTSFLFIDGNTYFLVWDDTGSLSGSYQSYLSGANANFGGTFNTPYGVRNDAIVAPANGNVTHIGFQSVSNFTGQIADVCVSDTSYAECSAGPPPPSNGLAEQLAAASSTIQDITGVDIQSAELWAGPHLLGVYAGSLIQTVYLYRGWIIVAAIIGALVWFVRRTYRFRKH